MQLRPEQLESHLEKALAPIYLLSGDEPLQLMEAADAVRAAARLQGVEDREVFNVDKGFDWEQLSAAAESLSLFARRRLLELRMPTGKPGAQGSKVLQAYARRPAEDTVLLIETGRLDASDRKTAWCKALESAGVLVQVWPLDLAGTQGWMQRRMRRHGLQPTADALRLLSERVEGNLLAATQEIDKLVLLSGPGPVDAEAVLSAVADSARFGVFDLVDAALAGETARAVRVLQGLRDEGIEAVLVLWALAREIRSLHRMAEQVEAGKPVQQILSGVRPQRRQPIVRQALRRHGEMGLGRLLASCARVDRAIKGRHPGNPWDELLDLTLNLAGTRVVPDHSPLTGTP
ncbi:DNA polymerase III subunit delta [Ectothiorhodospira variabilis]|uniref:DNA polymerase III subunit delta n=1 Tax=Ectothiorhodospira variabilis TaxID=505694 RepID=UPI001EFB50B8|nr:DNA polymerase III subunit delta [Ectothiorhodospira variabilis]MCG5495720.1 DNA polymerase III subunit delta [Ectothiorhodospira variabilis]MCG5498656.1 DNA polymerase III subunit delta [Ectothiorhodospira variabilis]MCG5503264.1 DNA polymerase III subunit delta [Ectothiorhodospira variabilis]MCG5505977.1 DNA polymerase III subunit delta [Ectothiorhodospira variabilis]